MFITKTKDFENILHNRYFTLAKALTVVMKNFCLSTNDKIIIHNLHNLMREMI